MLSFHLDLGIGFFQGAEGRDLKNFAYLWKILAKLLFSVAFLILSGKL